MNTADIFAHATTTGGHAHATTTGYSAHATTTGQRAHASVSGANSIAVAVGYNSCARATNGGFIVLAQYDGTAIVAVKTAQVGKDGIKPDTWYRLDATGEFVDAEVE